PRVTGATRTGTGPPNAKRAGPAPGPPSPPAPPGALPAGQNHQISRARTTSATSSSTPRRAEEERESDMETTPENRWAGTIRIEGLPAKALYRSFTCG